MRQIKETLIVEEELIQVLVEFNIFVNMDINELVNHALKK